MTKPIICFLALIPLFSVGQNQLQWKNVDSLYAPLPSSVHVYFTEQAINTAPVRAFYLIADLKDKKLDFTTDTSVGRRLTPTSFFEKNKEPVVVVNSTFFSFETNRNLNVVVKEGRTVAYNIHTVSGRGKDTLTYKHPFGSAIGINKKREADVAWTLTDSTQKNIYASQLPVQPLKDSVGLHPKEFYTHNISIITNSHDGGRNNNGPVFKKWKMATAIGGGPVLLQYGEIKITNNEELRFGGKAINDKHPRTAMGYTKDNKLIILVIEGRNAQAGGATLTQEAQILKDLGCVEALNLDGGGSSCMLVNGKETIKPSDATGQRAVPAVFLIRQK
jgi:hypothetical protein